MNPAASSDRSHKTVVVIVGDGRSGSTIVDMVLGELSDAVSVGELRFFWQRGLKLNQLCGCGEKFLECPFWTSVREPIELEIDRETKNTLLEIENYGSLTRYPLERIRSAWSVERSNYHKTLIEAYDRVYDEVFKVSKKNVIIDSSKSVYFAFFLQKYSRHDLKFLHVIRDSRAVAFSKQKYKERKEIHTHKEMMPKMGVLKSSFKWLIVNWLSAGIGNSSARMLVRYEDFALSPIEVVTKIARFLKLDPSAVQSLFDRDGKISMVEHHTISGNPSRFTNGPVKIESDDQWKVDTPPWRKAVINVISLPGLYRFYR
ncbi:MAG: sulfotransferase [Pseudomonadota bacterium]